MIRHVKDKETRKIWKGTISRKLPTDIQVVARRKLRMLNNARLLKDLSVPPANRLEALKGARKGQHSIRINNQYISQNRLARAMDVPPRRINEIVHGKRAVTADTALRLAHALGTSEQFWMGLQADYDLEEVRKSSAKALKKV
jgi:proteic killer suppression protein